MDSSIPPPPPSHDAAARLRPWYLVAAMMTTWLAGMFGFMNGFETARFLRSGRIPDLTMTLPQTGAALEVMASAGTALLRASLAHSRVAFPLSIAQALLAGLLILASGLAMTGRKGSRNLMIQAIVANAALSIAAYVLTRPLRAAYIEEFLAAAARIPELSRQRLPSAGLLFWLTRLRLAVIELGPLALALFAITRDRSKAFFEAAARVEESHEDP